MTSEQTGAEPLPIEQPIEDLFHHLEQTGVIPQGVTLSDAVTTVVCTFAMSVRGGEAINGVAPPSLQLAINRCIQHGETRIRDISDRSQFLDYIADHLNTDVAGAERLARAIFASVRAQLSAAELEHVVRQLPDDLATLWLR